MKKYIVTIKTSYEIARFEFKTQSAALSLISTMADHIVDTPHSAADEFEFIFHFVHEEEEQEEKTMIFN